MHKINRIHIYLILFIALFTHLTVLNYIDLFGAKPDIILLCVIFFGLFFGARTGAESGLFAGLLKDIFAFDLFGINTFSLGVTGLLVGIMNAKLFKESKTTQIALVFLFSIFSMMLHFIIESLVVKSLTLGASEYFIGSVMPSSLYTAIISIPIYSKFISIYNLKDTSELL